MTWVPFNVLQSPDDPKLNPQRPSSLVSWSQPRTGHGSGERAVPATVGGLFHGSRLISSQFCTLDPWHFVFSMCSLSKSHSQLNPIGRPSWSGILMHSLLFFSPYLCSIFPSIIKRLLWILLFLLRYRSPLSYKQPFIICKARSILSTLSLNLTDEENFFFFFSETWMARTNPSGPLWFPSRFGFKLAASCMATWELQYGLWLSSPLVNVPVWKKNGDLY